MAVDYNPFEGMSIAGRAETVTVRGQAAVLNGEFSGDVRRGQFVKREPNHF
jgi:dihydroorotase-like cyclic amidohydrolase